MGWWWGTLFTIILSERQQRRRGIPPPQQQPPTTRMMKVRSPGFQTIPWQSIAQQRERERDNPSPESPFKQPFASETKYQHGARHKERKKHSPKVRHAVCTAAWRSGKGVGKEGKRAGASTRIKERIYRRDSSRACVCVCSRNVDGEERRGKDDWSAWNGDGEARRGKEERVRWEKRDGKMEEEEKKGERETVAKSGMQ